MIRRIVAVLVITVLACTVLTSCGSVSLIRTVDSLLTPPLYYTEYEELVDAFNSSVGRGMILCSPSSGDYLSSITVSDIDSDGAEEGVVFYKDPLDNNTAHFAVFENVSGVWKQRGNFKGYGNEIKSLVLADLDEDGSYEIIVIWGYTGIMNADIFSFYRSPHDRISYKEVANETCDIAGVIDADSDGKEELFYVTTTKENEIVKKTAKLMKYSGDNLNLIGSAQVDPNIGGYVSLKTGINGNTGGTIIYLDATKTGDMMITEAVYWNESEGILEAPLFDPVSNSNSATLRYDAIQCADIDGDGKIEIPVQPDAVQGLENGEDTVSDVIPMTEWTYFDGDVPAHKIRTFVNSGEGYYVDIEKIGKSNLGVRTLPGTGWSGWLVYEEISGTGDNVLFSVIDVERDKWESLSGNSYEKILTRLDSIICVKIGNTGKNYGINSKNIHDIVKKLP